MTLDFSILIAPPSAFTVFSVLHAFMTQKEFFFFFLLFPCFFFKVITEQVVVDANLPSVSKESVGQVRAGGEGGRVGCLEALTVSVSSVSRA